MISRAARRPRHRPGGRPRGGGPRRRASASCAGASTRSTSSRRRRRIPIAAVIVSAGLPRLGADAIERLIGSARAAGSSGSRRTTTTPSRLRELGVTAWFGRPRSPRRPGARWRRCSRSRRRLARTPRRRAGRVGHRLLGGRRAQRPPRPARRVARAGSSRCGVRWARPGGRRSPSASPRRWPRPAAARASSMRTRTPRRSRWPWASSRTPAAWSSPAAMPTADSLTPATLLGCQPPRARRTARPRRPGPSRALARPATGGPRPGVAGLPRGLRRDRGRRRLLPRGRRRVPALRSAVEQAAQRRRAQRPRACADHVIAVADSSALGAARLAGCVAGAGRRAAPRGHTHAGAEPRARARPRAPAGVDRRPCGTPASTAPVHPACRPIREPSRRAGPAGGLWRRAARRSPVRRSFAALAGAVVSG